MTPLPWAIRSSGGTVKYLTTKEARRATTSGARSHHHFFWKLERATGRLNRCGLTLRLMMIIESPLDIVFRDLFYRLRAFAEGKDVS